MRAVVSVVVISVFFSVALCADEFLLNETGDAARGFCVVFSDLVAIADIGDMLPIAEPMKESARLLFAGGEVEAWDNLYLNWDQNTAKLVEAVSLSGIDVPTEQLPSPPGLVTDLDAVEPTGNTFTIATYNTMFLFDGIADQAFASAPQTVEQADQHIREIADVVARIEPDFIAFQEVERVKQLRAVSDLLLHPYDLIFVDAYDQTGQDTCALSRLQVEAFGRSDKMRAYPIPGSNIDCSLATSAPSWGQLPDSGTIGGGRHFWVNVDIGGIPTTIIGVHMISYVSACNRAKAREAQAEIIRALAQNVALDQGRELIILGDFNDKDAAVPEPSGSGPIADTLNILMNLDPASPGQELYNVASLLPYEERYTCYWDRNGNRVMDSTYESSVIDFILVSRSFWDRIINVTIDHSTDPQEVSDHWPVVLTMEMSEPIERITEQISSPPNRLRVLFDESHGEGLTTSMTRLSTMENPQWAGLLETAQAVELELGFEVDLALSEVTKDLLREADILVLAQPSASISSEEADLIEAFVRSGGGLLTLSSWGGEAVNSVLSRLGLSFLPGIVRTPSGDWSPQAYWAVIHPGPPIMERVGSHHVNGSIALSAPPSAIPLFSSPPDAWVDADGNEEMNEGEQQGELLLGAALSVEKGRVVALGDSSFHDQIWRNEVGSRTLIMNAISWLGESGGLNVAIFDSCDYASETSSPSIGQPAPSIILYNGTVVTMVSESNKYEAIAVAGDQILALGTDEEMLSLAGAETELVNLNATSVYPGFIDAHTHFLSSGVGRFGSIEAANEAAMELGITMMAEMNATPERVEEWISWGADGRLRSRHRLYLHYNNSCGSVIGDWYRDYFADQVLAPNIEIGGVKIFSGRSTCGSEWVKPSFSEALLSRSKQEAIDAYGNNEPLFNVDELTEIIASANSRGFQVAIHAFGDQEAQVSLEALSRVLRGEENELRHMILHNVFLSDDQIDTYADLDVVALVEPFAPCCERKDEAVFGEAFLGYYTRWRDLKESGVHIALDSDWPGITDPALNPLVRLQAVVTGGQVHPLCGEVGDCGTIKVPQTVSVWDGLRMLTSEAAYSLHHDHELGTLEPGKLADMVVLSQDPLDSAPHNLASIEVYLTMVDGKVEYRKEGRLEGLAGQRVKDADTLQASDQASTDQASQHTLPDDGSLGTTIEGVEIVGDSAYVIDWQSGVLFRVELATNSYREFETNLHGVNDLANDGDRLWLVNEVGAAKTLDLATGVLSEASLGTSVGGEVLGLAYERALYILVYDEQGPSLIRVSENGVVEQFRIIVPEGTGELIGLQCIGSDPSSDLITLDYRNHTMYRMSQDNGVFTASWYADVSQYVPVDRMSGHDIRGFFLDEGQAAFTSSGEQGQLFIVDLESTEN